MDPTDVVSVAAVAAEEFAARWQRGERPRAEDLFAERPELFDQTEIALRIIYEEVCLRQERGEANITSEILARFPRWRAELEALLGCHRLLQPTLGSFDDVQVGQSLAGYRLLAKLGRGARGAVFLASQTNLAGRSVVLKITPMTGDEHLSLARLQHTHIVPLYSAQDEPHLGLRLLVMPYFGGTSLDDLTQRLATIPLPSRSGSDLLKALDEAQANRPVPAPTVGPARKMLATVDYVQAICWMAACLAEALHDAHQRGLLHLDLKPANVLIASDSQPMLLDFHLARAALKAGDPSPPWFGGTRL